MNALRRSKASASDTWSRVREAFDEKLPRRTAILVKEEDWGLPFAYPCDFGGIGWNLDSREKTTYDESPVATIRFGDYSYPDLTRRHLARNTFYFSRMEYFPGLVKREVVFSNIGLEVRERFAQSPGGGWSWQLDLNCRNLPHYAFKKKLFTVLTFHEAQASVRRRASDGVLACRIRDKTLFLATDAARFGVFPTVDGYLEALEAGRAANRRTTGKHLVLEHDLAFGEFGERKRIAFGLSFRSAGNARRALRATRVEERTRRRWNAWFASLPSPRFAGERDRKAWYKCWWVIRSNYYKHPKWGKTVLEALPVYRGFWQWAMPAAEWHACLNPEVGPSFIRRLIDLFLKYQRPDGYVTHAIYLDEKVPGSGWGQRNIIQTPHIPWVALRYYNATRDLKSLKAWYPRLVKYYEYLNESRDRNFLNLHLWAIITSYDTGLDTTAAFQKVTYGERGVREKFCYPAVFAAERCRYEQAMGKMARILRRKDAAAWLREAGLSRRAMDRVLWDKRRNWYGVLHEDRTLDTRVGVDGLFPLAYALADRRKARLARRNFERLIGPYGIYTVAPGEPGHYEETYWRGPAWPKSGSLAMSAACRYYPQLKEKVKDGLVNFVLEHPSVWECMSARTGKIARGDMGLMAAPVVSSNVGAGEALGALLTGRGRDMFLF